MLRLRAHMGLIWILSACLVSAVSAQAQVRILSTDPARPAPLDLAAPETYRPAPPSYFNSDKHLEGDKQYKPEIGQDGKDVIWAPTPDSLIQAMMQVAAVKPGDYVVDLGSGDGRIAITAVRDYGARALGIEYNPDLVALARRNAARAGVQDRAHFKQADIFATDFSNATVVTLYLLPTLNLRLRATLLKMQPGTRILSHAFNMGDWPPERLIQTDDATGYYWIVPAQVAGNWAFEVGNQRFAVQLEQSYQNITPVNGSPLRSGQLKGRDIFLHLANGEILKGQVKGQEMSGQGWYATRIAARK